MEHTVSCCSIRHTVSETPAPGVGGGGALDPCLGIGVLLGI